MSIEKKSADIVRIEPNKTVHHSTRIARMRKVDYQDAFVIGRLCMEKKFPFSKGLIDALGEDPEGFNYVLSVARKLLATNDPPAAKDGVIPFQRMTAAKKKRKAA